MSVNESLRKHCQELFFEISDAERARNPRLKIAFDDLTSYLEDGAEDLDDEISTDVLAEVDEQLFLIFESISEQEKNENPVVQKRFDELEEHLAFLGSENGSEVDYPYDDDNGELDEDEEYDDDGNGGFDDDWCDEEEKDEENKDEHGDGDSEDEGDFYD